MERCIWSHGVPGAAETDWADTEPSDSVTRVAASLFSFTARRAGNQTASAAFTWNFGPVETPFSLRGNCAFFADGSVLLHPSTVSWRLRYRPRMMRVGSYAAARVQTRGHVARW